MMTTKNLNTETAVEIWIETLRKSEGVAQDSIQFNKVIVTDAKGGKWAGLIAKFTQTWKSSWYPYEDREDVTTKIWLFDNCPQRMLKPQNQCWQDKDGVDWYAACYMPLNDNPRKPDPEYAWVMKPWQGKYLEGSKIDDGQRYPYKRTQLTIEIGEAISLPETVEEM